MRLLLWGVGWGQSSFLSWPTYHWPQSNVKYSTNYVVLPRLSWCLTLAITCLKLVVRKTNIYLILNQCLSQGLNLIHQTLLYVFFLAVIFCPIACYAVYRHTKTLSLFQWGRNYNRKNDFISHNKGRYHWFFVYQIQQQKQRNTSISKYCFRIMKPYFYLKGC